MSKAELITALPLLTLALTPVVALAAVACRRSHAWTTCIGAVGLLATLLVLALMPEAAAPQVAGLLTIDGQARFFTGLIAAASLVVLLLGHGYLADWPDRREEFSILVLLATLGAAVLTASVHFASFFLGLELLSVSLYALIAYPRWQARALEAGVKYLVLAAVSSSFLLFGMALVYAATGTMAFAHLDASAAPAGFALIAVGIGFKLGLVPFHLWTPDVYEGAPAPATALIATVSKGGVLALLLRLGGLWGGTGTAALAAIAIASMAGGTLLALLQDDLKRLLAYSSIAHLGFLLVAFLASGYQAAAFYLTAYFATILTAFAVISALAIRGEEHATLDDYRGLFSEHPWLAAALAASVLSLAGLPLTAGFIGKFGVVRAGVDAGSWTLVLVLVASSAVGLFYYLRVLVAVFAPQGPPALGERLSAGTGALLAVMVLLVLWLGVDPGPVMEVIRVTVGAG